MTKGGNMGIGEAMDMYDELRAKRRTELFHLKAMILGQWSKLKWRRHGVGILQAYLIEDVEFETRVHVWHPDLIRDGITDYGDIHDHRFSFVSTILLGTICNSVVTPEPDVNGDYRVYQVAHARINPSGGFCKEPMVVVPGPLESTAERVSVRRVSTLYHDGDSYRFLRGIFHASLPIELAITFITKYDQIDAGARILGKHDRTPVAAFNPDDLENVNFIRTMGHVLKAAKVELEKSL
jgi:hypothetical protein